MVLQKAGTAGPTWKKYNKALRNLLVSVELEEDMLQIRDMIRARDGYMNNPSIESALKYASELWNDPVIGVNGTGTV
jgi:hypothetical protein